MDEIKANEPIPYLVYDEEMARQERTQKRLWILVIILIAILLISNGAWLYYESQFEDVTMTQTATTDGGGDAIANGTATGDIYYGDDSNTDNKSKTQESGR